MILRPAVERRFVSMGYERIHVARCGAGLPVLHQAPRRWDEHPDAVPLPDQLPGPLSDAILRFLDGASLTAPKESSPWTRT